MVAVAVAGLGWLVGWEVVGVEGRSELLRWLFVVVVGAVVVLM